MSRAAVIRVGPGDSTLRARLLGAQLREKREAAGLTGRDVAKRIRRAHSSLSRWEAGDQIPRPGDLMYMLELYGVRGPERDDLMRLAEDAHEQHETSETVSMAVADYEWLQARAQRLDTWQPEVVPDLLQTPDYAREMLRAWDPTVGRERVERTLAARIARQDRLVGRAPLKVCAVIGESAVRQSIGGPDKMCAQLRHILDRAALPSVEIRLVTHSAGAHPGLVGSFTILRFSGDGKGLARVPTSAGDVYFEDIDLFAGVFRRIKGVALCHQESVAKIAAMAKEMI